MPYDVSSSYLEGRCCHPARLGYDHDARRESCRSSTACVGPGRLPSGVRGRHRRSAHAGGPDRQFQKRFALGRVALVRDRGMITQARLDAEIAPAGFDWITGIAPPPILALADARILQMWLAAITSSHYPDERLIVCRSPDLRRERTRKREDLLAAPEADLAVITATVQRARNSLRGEAAIVLKVGTVVGSRRPPRSTINTSFSTPSQPIQERLRAPRHQSRLYLVATSSLTACKTNSMPYQFERKFGLSLQHLNSISGILHDGRAALPKQEFGCV